MIFDDFDDFSMILTVDRGVTPFETPPGGGSYSKINDFGYL